MKRSAAVFTIALALVFVAGNLAVAQGNSPTYVSPPVSAYGANFDLRQLPPVSAGQISPIPPGAPIPEVPLLTIPGPVKPPASPESKRPDPLWNSGGLSSGNLSVTPLEFSNPSPNFDGQVTVGVQPPDPNGAVGPNHYIQIVNEAGPPLGNARYMVFDKTGAALTGTLALSSLWVAAQAPVDDPCRSRGRGDPYVLYDHLADRWLLSQFADLNSVTGLHVECIAISQGPNPVTDGWYVYTFQLPFSNDYPKIGVWPDGYYMISQEGYNGNPLDATVFDRANMLNGNPATFQSKSFAGPPTIIMLPSDLTGPPPVPGTPNFYVRPVDGNLFGGSDRIQIFEFHVDWGVPANTTFNLVQTLTPASFSSDICAGANLFQNCIEQPGGGTKLEAMTVWPMGPLQYRNFGTFETLVFNHTVDVDTALAGIRWYELRRSGGSWSIHQQGTFSPPDGQRIHRWMGSITMDKAGNMALGYSVSNNGVASTVFPGIRYAGRLASDPPGEMPFGEVTLVAGGARFGGTRWGDYSAIRIDPVDGCTFWYTTQYIPADGSQHTRIGAFRFPTCNPADLAITKTADRVVVQPGGDLFYTLTVTNLGPDPANDVIVTDTLPAGVTFIVATDDCTQGPPTTLTCRLGDLANGQTVSFVVKVRVKTNILVYVGGSTTITNSATVTSSQFDPDNTNNTAKVTTIIEKNKKRKER
jgi:uncharacterized repeat protein (TIGR01451 family)